MGTLYLKSCAIALVEGNRFRRHRLHYFSHYYTSDFRLRFTFLLTEDPPEQGA